MIRSLRWKFIWLAMLSLLGTMTVLCVSIGVGNHWITTRRVDRAISLLHQNGGTFLPPGVTFDPSDFEFQVTPETAFETRYFIVELTEQREVKAVDLEHIAAFDRHSVTETISKVIQTGGSRGYVDYYRFGLFPSEDGGSTMIVMDCFLMLQAADNMLRITVIIFCVCALIVFLLLLFFSGRAIRPFAENLERQRQFVTDASHELKTPLSILSADLDLLSDSCGESRWLGSARTQIARLDKLIRNLVELARTEETIREGASEVFSLSDIALASAEVFAPLAEAEGNTLAAEVAAGVELRGVQDDLFRLFSILLDNAVKYCDAGGTIRLSVSQRGRTVRLSVSNPCAGLNPAQLPRYFDRFYRADSSRSRTTGGYGIGLSTARAIVARHRGRLTNHYANGIITFTALLTQVNEKRGNTSGSRGFL
ncbi:cell wall metabolism sensor histidine kinase WalK [uncultured Oscillibacter sp.]|uniref:sensor histidine kinase n=1 Tax=uncultured Oscillibacter sp. TaxID=876091 RepID=UPI002729A4AC|nr:HAMP domain-containing sensor histidine kinase [uncultured Oscillibacter sp.]